MYVKGEYKCVKGECMYVKGECMCVREPEWIMSCMAPHIEIFREIMNAVWITFSHEALCSFCSFAYCDA